MGELVETLNKDFVMVHAVTLNYGWTKGSNIDLCRLKHFYGIIVKNCSAIMVAGLSDRKLRSRFQIVETVRLCSRWG